MFLFTLGGAAGAVFALPFKRVKGWAYESCWLFYAIFGLVVLLGVIGSLAGIALVGLAGKSKEGELTEKQKKKAVAEFDFKKGLRVALFSGIASAGMNFGLQSGSVLQEAAVRGGTLSKWQGMPVLVVVLLGGFAVNAAWCLTQNLKNKTLGDYANARTPVVANIFFAGLAGVIWAMQVVCQKVGEPAMGEMAYIGFAIVMGSAIFFSSLVGVLLGEWQGAGPRTKRLLGLGILTLLISFGVISWGNKLKAQVARAEDHAEQCLKSAGDPVAGSTSLR